MTDYQGDPYDGLKTEEIADEDLTIATDYCLSCLCGRRTRGCRVWDGSVSFSNCPHAEEYNSVHYYPETFERYQRQYHQPPNLPVECSITVFATHERICIPLKELLLIPKGWTLAVQEDKDNDDYLDLNMEMTLHRIPDKAAYDKWNQDMEQARKSSYREEEIARLQQRLEELSKNQ